MSSNIATSKVLSSSQREEGASSALVARQRQRQRTLDRVYAIVPTFNRKHESLRALQSIQQQTYPVYRILIVDNASTDGTREMCAQEFAQAQYIRLPMNAGSAGGFYHGIQAAVESQDCDWVWLMDDDAIASPTALECLMNVAQRGEGSVYNSLVVTPDGQLINWGYHMYTGTDYRGPRRMFKTVSELSEFDTPVLNGLAQFYPGALIRKEVILTVGLPEIGYFTRGDEVDYVLRVQVAGYRTLTVPQSRVFHPPERQTVAKVFGLTRTCAQMSPLKQYYSIRNGIINHIRYRFAPFGIVMGVLRLLWAHLLISMAEPVCRRKRFAYTFAGLLDGLLGRVYINKKIW